MFWTTSRLSQRARSWYTTSIPSRPASFGPWMCTSRPSKMIWPPSAAWVPATHLTSVDLPAPLSPTSAITSPRRTSKSTPASACTEPNDLEMSRSWRRGVSSLIAVSGRPGWRRPGGRLHRQWLRMLFAVLLVLPDADFALLEPALREELLVVRLRDPLHRQRERRLLLLAVQAEAVRLRLLALEERERRRHRGLRLVRDVLVDRAALPAGEDVLDAL